jgi:hypothetical protein
VKDRLISESITPILDAPADADRDAPAGEPVLPLRFVWQGTEHVVSEVLERWKEYSSGSPAMPDRYLRKHWYRVRTREGIEMTLYFQRQARTKGQAKRRWWLFSIRDPE